MGREQNLLTFQDTEKQCETNPKLRAAIRESVEKQVLILEKECVERDGVPRYQEPAKIIISKKRTYEAALAYRGQQTAVLNFASSTNPGGGVILGANAQEECLCRCSTLYPNLNADSMWEGFYLPHRRRVNPLHNDDCIYTPDVLVFKTDTAEPEMMPEKDWYPVNVITCAAPNLWDMPSNQMNPGDGHIPVAVANEDLQALHEKRMGRVLDIAAVNGNDVVILGAFGCGAFSNPPEVVAQAMKQAVTKHRYDFKVVEFAVYCSPWDERNYRIFEHVLKEM